MTNVVVVIEEGRSPDWSVEHVVERYRRAAVRIHLLNVRTPLPSYVARFIPRAERRAYHEENGARAMQVVVRRLDELAIPHKDHVLVGNKAEMILQFAHEQSCSEIIVAKRGTGLLPELGLGSIGSQLRHLLGADARCKVAEVS